MFWNYLKIAFRNLLRKKFYTIINIAGLAIGISSAIMIGLYVLNELSYDKYNKNYERIYRLESHFNIQGSDDFFALTALPLAPAIKLEFQEDVEQYCRYRQMDNNLFQFEGRKYFEDNVWYADSTVFDVFSYEFLRGESSEALDDPNEIVLTESFAHRIFGAEDPLGEYLETGYGFGFTVTGVIKDLPQNSHLNFEALGSMITLAQFYPENTFHSLESQMFWNVGFFSFIKLKEGGAIDNIMQGYPAFDEKYIKPVGQHFGEFQLLTQRIDKVHLNPNLGYDLPAGNIAYVYIFGVVALFLLLVGCINYMNMATAQSAGRATEVGIRKVSGAQRGALQRQFLLESVIISLLALIVAILAVELLLPSFNELAGRELSLNISKNLNYYVYLLILSIIVGLISGSYPAFYLSSFIPVEVLKGRLNKGRSVLRKLLVVVQFSISIIMIICTMGVVSQLRFMQESDQGFDKENLIVLTIRDTTGARNLRTFKDELLKHPNILKAGTSSSIPGRGYGIVVQRYESDSGEMVKKAINFVFMDRDYLNTMGIKILKGRNFNPEMATDLQEASLVNLSCAQDLGWGENALDKKLYFGVGENEETAQRKTRVIGIVKDFHYSSLHNIIDPLIFLLSEEPLRTITLRVDQKDIESTLGFMEEKWNEFCPTFPFSYDFLEDNLNAQYEAEEKTGRVFIYFTIICIFIACLGLFGLTSYAIEQRIKEISIRKVLGSSEKSIIFLLIRNFATLVIISNIIAWPLAWFGLKKWLENFAYTTEISPLIYVTSGFLALLIATITISIKAIGAARTNPADALKHE